MRGDPKPHQQAMLEEQGLGETRSFTASAAEGCVIRGNSKNHRRRSRKIEEPGRPGESIERRSLRRRAGATRRFDEGGTEGCGTRGNSKNHRRHPEDEEEGKPDDSSQGEAKVEGTGKPGASMEAALKDGEREETR